MECTNRLYDFEVDGVELSTLIGEFDTNLNLKNVNWQGKDENKTKASIGKLPKYKLNIKSNVGDLELTRN